jgi:hypothetical protein
MKIGSDPDDLQDICLRYDERRQAAYDTSPIFKLPKIRKLNFTIDRQLVEELERKLSKTDAPILPVA